MSPEQRDQIVEMRISGKTYREIAAAMFPTSVRRVREICRSIAATSTTVSPQVRESSQFPHPAVRTRPDRTRATTRRHTEMDLTDVSWMRAQGLSYSHISDVTGIPTRRAMELMSRQEEILRREDLIV